jgi:hypothetical protein
MRVGYVLRVHANQGQILVSTHYHGTPLANSLMESEGAAAGRTALGLGTLATQSGTFSGTSSGTNTGDQTASTVANTPSGNIAATTVQAALNELDSEKTTAAAALAAADAAIQSAFTAYSPHGYLNSDGATSNRGQIQGPFDAVNNPRGWVAGAATLTWRGVVTVPTSNPSVQTLVFGLAAISNNSAQENSIALYIETTGNGDFSLAQFGSTLSLYRNLRIANFRQTYSGQTGVLEVVFTKGTTDPVVRWNDVILSTTLVLSATPPDWLDAAMVPTYHLTGYNWPAGPAPVGCWILGSLTDADSAFHRSTGQYPAWVVAGGSAETLSLTTWTGTGLTTNTSTTVDGTPSYIIYQDKTVSRGHSTLILTGNCTTYTGGIVTTVVVGGVEYNPVEGIITATGIFTRTFTGLPPHTTISLRVIRGVVGSGAAGIASIAYKYAGALSLPGLQPCNVVDDLTTIGGNQARLVGVTPVTPKRDWRISADTWANGNQRILEGALIDSTADIIDTIEQTTTGTPTTTIGSASAGSQYKAGGALTAGINPTTLVTRKAASNEFWVGSNSTAMVRTTIMGHRAN